MRCAELEALEDIRRTAHRRSRICSSIGRRHMATGEQTIAALATHTGIDHAHVQRTARILREVGADLWPQSGRGGGRRARHQLRRRDATQLSA